MLITPALLASLNVTRSQFAARVNTLVARMATDDSLVLLACIRLYAFQTQDEKRIDATVHDNGVGFQYMDAKFGGRMARLLNNGEVVFAHNMPRLRRMARKYRNQLAYLSFRKEQRAREDKALAAITPAVEVAPQTLRSAA